MKKLLKSLIRRLGLEVRRTPRDYYYSPLPLRDILSRYDEEAPFRNIIDVGANSGQTAEEYAAWFPAARIHSLEPHAETFLQLEKNIRRYGNVAAYRLALGDSDGRQILFVNRASVTNSILPSEQSAGQLLKSDVCSTIGEETIEVRTLKTFLAGNQIDRVDLLKIDAQGYEDRILRGAAELLTPRNIRLVLLEINFVGIYAGQASVPEIWERMLNSGYRLYSFYDTWSRHDIGYMWTNALFVPEQGIL